MKNKLLAAAKTARARAKNALKKQSGIPEHNILSTESALKVIYYMMAADGLVFYSEEEKFDAIGRELDPAFAANRDSIVRECKKHLESIVDADSYYDVLQEGAENALRTSKAAEGSFVTPKLLIWDLLTIAFSEEHYDEDERKLLTFVAQKMNVEEDVFREMENSIQALMDVEKELARIKTAGKPDAAIEAAEKELTDRKNMILESIQDLITE